MFPAEVFPDPHQAFLRQLRVLPAHESDVSPLSYKPQIIKGTQALDRDGARKGARVRKQELNHKGS